jgi:formate/nitrite transporter FocA (FNT family)
MRFLKSDLMRSLAMGFALGSLLVGVIFGTELMTGNLVGAATAAAPPR